MKLLLGLDGSDLSMRALDETIDRAREAGDSVAVAVFEGPEPADLDEIAATARERLTEADVDAEFYHLENDPGSQLVELGENGFDRIVMGGGTISPMGKIRIGDVIEFVLVNTQTSITLVR